MEMSAHDSLPLLSSGPAYFAALHAARAIFRARFSHFKWNDPEEEALGSPDWLAKFGRSLWPKPDEYFSARSIGFWKRLSSWCVDGDLRTDGGCDRWSDPSSPGS